MAQARQEVVVTLVVLEERVVVAKLEAQVKQAVVAERVEEVVLVVVEVLAAEGVQVEAEALGVCKQKRLLRG